MSPLRRCPACTLGALLILGAGVTLEIARRDLQETPAAPLRSLRLDPNTAAAPAWRSLPGIGPVIAQRIVDDRGARGDFRSREDLVRVTGLGPRMVQRLTPELRDPSR